MKKKVVGLRRLGYSYSLINLKTGVAKGTLSGWLKDIPYKPNKIVLKRIQESLVKSARILRFRKIKAIELAKQIAVKEIGTLTDRDLWMIGIGLYIGEGSKGKIQIVRIVNSDPKVIKLAIVWFKRVCGLGMNNFRISIHTYPDINLEKTLNYWSRVTSIPREQFRKTYVDIRTNKSSKNINKLLYATAHLTVYANGEKKYGVFLFRRIMGWIEFVEKQFQAGIV